MKKIPLEVLLKKSDYKALYDIQIAINSVKNDEFYVMHLEKIKRILIEEALKYWQDSETIEIVLLGANKISGGIE